MPCMQNGRPVPGNKGACPYGSTWSDTAGNDQFEWSDVGDFLKKRYTTEKGDVNALNLGLDALIFIPGIGWTARGALAGGKGLAGLMGRMFTKGKMKTEITKKDVLKNPEKWADYIKNNPKGAIPWREYKTITTKNKVPLMRTNRKGVEVQARQFAPVKSAVTAGIAAQGADYFAPFTQAGIAAKEGRDERSAALATQTQEDETVKIDATATEAAVAQAEKDRVAGLSFTEKMKEPGYWDEIDATGLTRIQRLGQLMSYYGQTPKQRAATTSPADRWAEMSTTNAATAASIQKSLKTVNNPMSSIGNKQSENMIASIVEKRYGNTKIPGDVMFGFRKDKKTLESITSYISARMNALIDAGGEWDASLQQAIEDYEKIQDQF